MPLETEDMRSSEQQGGQIALRTQRYPGIFTALVLVGIASYLYFNLFVFFNVPVLQGDDQVFFWMNAQRMLHGERVYLDFFQYTPPGTDLLFLAMFKLFGPRIWVLNAAVLALGAALSAVCYTVASQIMERRLALLAACFYLIVIFSKPLNATHHWFSVLAIMCGVAVLMKSDTPSRIAIAGAWLGLAAFFTQTHGFVAALSVAVFLIWEQLLSGNRWQELRNRLLSLLLGFVSALLVLNAYFIVAVGVPHLWAQQVTYVWRYAHAGVGSRFWGLPEFSSWRELPAVGQQIAVYVSLPVIYLVSLRRSWRERTGAASNGWRQPALLSVLGSFLLMEVALNPNWLRVYAVSMPGMILLVWIVSQFRRIRRPALLLLCAGISCLAVRQVWMRHHQGYVVAELRGGKAAVSPQAYEELRWITQRTTPGEFLFQAAWPGVYIPLDLRNPLFLDAVGTTEQTRPEYVDLAIRQLEDKNVRHVVWSRRLDNTVSGRPSEDHLAPLRAYLRLRYIHVMTFAAQQDEVWERK
jgi:hypothetical protein